MHKKEAGCTGGTRSQEAQGAQEAQESPSESAEDAQEAPNEVYDRHQGSWDRMNPPPPPKISHNQLHLPKSATTNNQPQSTTTNSM
jgi:hypothetical protein